jgi:hypothetical protein
MDKHKLIIEFESNKALRCFASWLSERGEYKFNEWMKETKQDRFGKIKQIIFEYWDHSNLKKYFVEDNIIRSKYEI